MLDLGGVAETLEDRECINFFSSVVLQIVVIEALLPILKVVHLVVLLEINHEIVWSGVLGEEFWGYAGRHWG